MPVQLDFEMMERFCSATEEAHVKAAADSGRAKIYDTPDGFLVHYDNNSPVLAVAHLDSVIEVGTDNHFVYYPAKTEKDIIVASPQLDDRLGAYIIGSLLPRMGLNFDVLFTTNEEHGCSTASHFKAPDGRTYNWMFQFDRQGDDAVTYQQGCTEFLAKLRESGFKIGHGSYSDTASLDHLGIAGINIGCGYHSYHSSYAWASMKELIPQVEKFANFFNLYRDTRFPWEDKGYGSYASVQNWQGWQEWGDYWDTKTGKAARVSTKTGKTNGHQKVTPKQEVARQNDALLVCSGCDVQFEARSGLPAETCLEDFGLCCTCYLQIIGTAYPFLAGVEGDSLPSRYHHGDEVIVYIPGDDPEYAPLLSLDGAEGSFLEYDQDPDWAWCELEHNVDGHRYMEIKRLPIVSIFIVTPQGELSKPKELGDGK